MRNAGLFQCRKKNFFFETPHDYFRIGVALRKDSNSSLQRQAQRLEYVTPADRAAAMVESLDADVAEALRVERRDEEVDFQEAPGRRLA